MEQIKKIVRKLIKKLVVGIYHIQLSEIATDERLIVFDSSTGANYTGSPKAIYERMVELGLDNEYNIVWFFKKGKIPKEPLSGRVKIIKYGSISYLWTMLRAKIWIFDARQAEFIRKRKDQHYIQIWHGTPLKKLALDLTSVNMQDNKDLTEYKRSFRENTSIWDYLVVQNDFSEEIFKSCFVFSKTFLRIGYPRNDVLFKKNNYDDILKIKQKFGLPLEKKILLYAPTWRDNEYDAGGNYEFKPKLDFALLRERLNKDYVVIVKYHYLIGNKIDWSGFEGFVYPFGADADISELYLVADEMVTDYSSVMFDYALLKRQMYFYAYDLDKYEKELRGFYFDFINEAPGPISKNTDELIRDILTSEDEKNNKYFEKKQKFYKKFNTYEDGFASDNIIKLVEKIMEL